MARKSYTREQILEKLNFVMSKYNQGHSIDEACKAAEIGKATYYRWRDKYCRLDARANNTTEPITKSGDEDSMSLKE